MIQNALTIDVEDYFQVSAFENVVSRKNWDSYDLRVEHNTHALLEILDANNTNATFFILGWVAERCPDLVREIARQGHEIACHGYSHKLVYKQSETEFREETCKSKKILEDICGKAVTGYRAASYSITKRSLWALDILIEAGFEYDSSIFPVRHDRYGIAGSPRFPYIIDRSQNRTIIEFPMSTGRMFGMNIPVSGGGYFRLIPYPITRKLLSGINENEKQPFIFYLHPWEIDPDQPVIEASRISNLRHYTNIRHCRQKFEKLLASFRFTTVAGVLNGNPVADSRLWQTVPGQ